MGVALYESHSEALTRAATLASQGVRFEVARRLFPNAPQPWLDLSTGTNPIAYPVGAMDPAIWERVPVAEDLRALEAIAGRRFGAPSRCSVVAGPGTMALIHLLPALCAGRAARVLGPTFAGYERVFQDADRQTQIVPSVEALQGADVAIVINPSNPDGRLIAPEELLALADRVGILIVDEAFIDALPPTHSVVPRLTTPRIIVLRSFGKIHGLAGLRLGFALCGADVAARLRQILGPWPISGPALAIGAGALADDTWLSDARGRLAIDMARLTFHLRNVGATRVGGTPLFCLVAHPAAASLLTALGEAGILVHPSGGEATLLRIGCPGTVDGWSRLETALKAFHDR